MTEPVEKMELLESPDPERDQMRFCDYMIRELEKGLGIPRGYLDKPFPCELEKTGSTIEAELRGVK